MMVRAGALALQGDTEGPGRLQPGKGMALVKSSSSTY